MIPSDWAGSSSTATTPLTAVDDQGTTGLPQVTLTYDYDNAGNRTSLADSKGGLTTYAYDVRNQLTRITQAGTGVEAKRVDFDYDGDGRPREVDRYKDLSGADKVVATNYSYDGAGRITWMAHQLPAPDYNRALAKRGIKTTGELGLSP